MLHDVVGCMYHWFNSVECIDNLAIPNGNSEKLHHHHRSLSATINTSVSLSDLPHCHMNGNKVSHNNYISFFICINSFYQRAT
jgi:hypothetical protein